MMDRYMLRVKYYNKKNYLNHNYMEYIEKTLYVYAKVLILITVINSGVSMFGNQYNILLRILQTPRLMRYFYVFIALIAIWVGIKRETYLPFLGECVIPHTVLKNGSNVVGDKLVELTIDAPEAKQIVWWGSNQYNPEQSDINTALKAYGDYMNSGVTEVVNGIAKIAFLCPQEYTVKKHFVTKTLKKHIHYREVNNTGMIGAIKTVNVDC